MDFINNRHSQTNDALIIFIKEYEYFDPGLNIFAAEAARNGS